MRYKPTDYEWAKRPFLANKPRGVLRVNDLLAHDLFRLTSPAEAGFVKAGNRFPLFGIMRQPRNRLHF